MNSMKAMEIYKKIGSADWYYNYSDDYGYYKRGEAECREVIDFIKSNDRPVKTIKNNRYEKEYVAAHIEFRSWKIHNTIKKFELKN
jgi:hypothetical protein